MKNLPNNKHQSYICSNFWHLIGGKPHKFTQRSFHLYTDSKFIKVPGIFGIRKQLKSNFIYFEIKLETKKNFTVKLCNVKEVREGFATDKWLEFKYRQKTFEISPNFYYFSIILRSTSSEIMTLGLSLDLMTNKFDDYQLWIGTLKKLLREMANIDSKIYLNQIVLDKNNNLDYGEFDKFVASFLTINLVLFLIKKLFLG